MPKIPWLISFWICSRDDNIWVLLSDEVDIANREIFADDVTSVVTPDDKIDLDSKIFLNNHTWYRAIWDRHWRSCPKEPYKLGYQTRPAWGYHLAELGHLDQCWTIHWTSCRWTRWSRPWWPGWRPRTILGCCRAGTEAGRNHRPLCHTTSHCSTPPWLQLGPSAVQ